MRVAIIGAGVGGLTLAAELHRRGVKCDVYEAAPAFAPGPRGGDLGWSTEVRFVDQRGRLVRSSPGDPARWVRWDALREQSLKDLPAGVVHGGYRLVEARPGNEIVFANGERMRPEILIGADGIRSRVRALVSPVLAEYTGRICVEARNARPEPDVLDLVGPGRLLAEGEGKHLSVLPEQEHQHSGDGGGAGRSAPGGALSITAWFPGPEDHPAIADAKEAVVHFADWDERLRDLIGHSTILATYPEYQTDPGHRWEHQPGVTLIGDAAHYGPPMRATRDARMLAHALAAYPDPDAALRAYENEMINGG